jgi:hypothetical protein
LQTVSASGATNGFGWFGYLKKININPNQIFKFKKFTNPNQIFKYFGFDWI